jgi:hypothetical protein
MGHSFGCIVVSAMLAGPRGAGLIRPVHSAALLQGAFSLWSYCSDIPVARGRPGYFHGVVNGGRVAGPIITSQSTFDVAVGRYYTPWRRGGPPSRLRSRGTTQIWSGGHVRHPRARPHDRGSQHAAGGRAVRVRPRPGLQPRVQSVHQAGRG